MDVSKIEAMVDMVPEAAHCNPKAPAIAVENLLYHLSNMF